MTLIPQSEPGTKIEDTNFDSYRIVYKPKLRGVCDLNDLYLNQRIVI